MNNYKKISIVSEYNKKTKKWDIKTIVIFRNNDSPIVEDYDRNKHLNLIREFIELIGHDILHEGLKSAKDNGKITIISKSDKKNVEILNKEVLEEQIKYSNSRNKKVDQTLGMNVEKQKIEIEKLLNDCRKINIVYENDEINNRKIPKQIVIFRNNGEPIIEKYNDAKHLKFCQLFAEKCGFDLSNNGVEEAIRANFIATTLNYRKESLDALNAEILDDQLKFSKVQNATLENKNDNMTVGKVEQILPGKSEHDLDEYFALDEKRNNGKISSDEKKRLEELSSNNRKIAFLENAKVLYNAGEISEDTYLTIKDSYKNKLNRKNQEQKKGKSIFSRLKLNRKGIGNTAMKINDNSTDRIVPIPVGKEKLSVKLKRHWKKIIAGILTAVALVTGVKIFSNSKKPTINRVQINTGNTNVNNSIGTNDLNSTYSLNNQEDRSDLLSSINYYFDTMKVPVSTQKFILQENVQQFLSQYTNISQLREVLSALCYGYEANVLNSLVGNFRLEKDGENYLRSFTNDFLCAKVVVNNYTPEQMLAVFGNSNVSYEQIMDGFKSYCSTVTTYGTTATKVLPFKYLTNGDNIATNALNELFEKLAIVNKNRIDGTLTSEHTDDFIVAVDNFFVHDDQKLKLTEGLKTVAASLVYSYTVMQDNYENGEALYLHKTNGLSKAGINLLTPDITEPDGTIISENKDSLLNYIYLLYANNDLVNQNCLTQKQILLNNINEMHRLSNADQKSVMTSFANLLYQNGLYEYGNEVSQGHYSSELLNKIENANPALASDIDNFEQSLRTASNNSYISFDVATTGIDRLLGINGLTNSYNFLINVRESMAADTKNYTVKSGKWYGIPSTSYDGSYHVPAPTVTVTTSQEKVDYSDLSASEKESADEQREQLILDEKKKNDEQQAIVTEDAQSLVEKIENGEIVTQEQAEDFFSQNGGILDQGFVEDTITDYTKPQLTEQIDSEYAAREEQEAAEAAVAIEQERKEQADRYQEQLDVIQQGGSFVDTDPDYSSDPNVGNPAVDEQPQTEALTETSSADSTGLVQDTSNQVVEETTFEAPSIDYSSDPNVGNPAVDEQPYTESLPSAKEELQLMRNALADVNPEVLGLTGEVDLGYAKKLNL